jgi:ribonuclease P protein component
MFPRNYKLILRKLPGFFDKAHRIHSGSVTVFVTPSTATHTKIVVIVPKRVAQKATARTALKRAFYQAATPWLPKLAALQLNIVVVVQRLVAVTAVTQTTNQWVAKLTQ